MTLTLEISDAVAETLSSYAHTQGKDVGAYATAALTAHAAGQPINATQPTEAQIAAACAELENLRPHDMDAVFRKFGVTRTHETLEEMVASTDRIIAALSPEQRGELQRQGLI